MTRNFLLQYQELAFLRLFPSLRGKFLSPFREDRRPGCFFWKSKKTGIIYFVDFADTKTHRNAIDFYMEYYDVSYNEAVNIILTGDVVDSNVVQREKRIIEKSVKKSTIINYKVREIMDIDKKYWNDYGINIFKYKDIIKPISYYEIHNVIFYPVLAYTFAAKCTKIYKPAVKGQKKGFISNCRKIDVIKPFDVDYDKVIFITTSWKDLLVLYDNGIKNIIAVQSESMGLPKSELNKIKKAMLLYDNDEAGHKYAEMLAQKIDKVKIIYPDEKDYADMAKIGKDIKKYLKSRG
jgi:hypothetical protein